MKDHDSQKQATLPNGLPETPVGRWTRPFLRFMQIESAGGFVLLGCTVAALVLANSAWSAAYTQIWQTSVGFAVGDFELSKPLLLWINDGLMTLFFFVVGLEIKHGDRHGSHAVVEYHARVCTHVNRRAIRSVAGVAHQFRVVRGDCLHHARGRT